MWFLQDCNFRITTWINFLVILRLRIAVKAKLVLMLFLLKVDDKTHRKKGVEFAATVQ